MNTDTYQNALESTKDSIEDVNNAIGFSLGSLTLEKLITSAITLVILVLAAAAAIALLPRPAAAPVRVTGPPRPLSFSRS